MLHLEGRDDRATYRTFCDRCGDKLCDSPLLLGQARRLGQGHANLTRHPVRIEPWDSFVAVATMLPDPVELVPPQAGPYETR